MPRYTPCACGWLRHPSLWPSMSRVLRPRLNVHTITSTFSEYPAHTQQDPNLTGLLPAAPGMHSHPPIPHQHPLRRPVLLETSAGTSQTGPPVPGWQQFPTHCWQNGPDLSLGVPLLISTPLQITSQSSSPPSLASKEARRWFSHRSHYRLATRDGVELSVRLGVAR